MNPRAAVSFAVVAVLVAGGVATAAADRTSAFPGPSSVTAAVTGRTVTVSWAAETFPNGTSAQTVDVYRNGALAASLDGAATSWVDSAVRPRQSDSYVLVAHAAQGPRTLTSSPSASVRVTLPDYFVGAATTDITPAGVVNLGGFGLGDGTVIPSQITSRGGQAGPSGAHIRARAIVVDDGSQAVAIADIETQ